jgi:hypothetical protein
MTMTVTVTLTPILKADRTLKHMVIETVAYGTKQADGSDGLKITVSCNSNPNPNPNVTHNAGDQYLTLFSFLWHAP